MATKTPAALLLLWLVVVATSPRAALGDSCVDGCTKACMGWRIVCRISCTSACAGNEGIASISTMSTTEAAAAPPKHPAAAAPLPEVLVVLRKGLKPSSAN